jgi:hypothetical protein
MGIRSKVTKVVTAPVKAVVKGAKALGDALDPAEHAARAIDKAVDTFKDDEFVIEGESHLTLFGVAVGSLKHRLRATVADKE